MQWNIDTKLAWDFDIPIISHCHCLRGGAKEDVCRAFDRPQKPGDSTCEADVNIGLR